jgi:hypothetical protein
MKKLTTMAGACLFVLLSVLPVSAANIETYHGPVAGTNLTMQECQNLGCTYVEAPSCPVIMHDYSPRRWACKCPNGTSCLDESSPH